MKSILMILSIVSLVFMACEKEGSMGPSGKDGATDKQIRFTVGYNSNSGFQDTIICTLENSSVGIHQFNIENYENVDSAVLVVYSIKTATNCCGAPDVVKTMKIELFDIANKNSIVGSTIISDDIPNGTYISSGNFFNNLPKKTVDLGIRIIFDKNYFGSTGYLYLFLYRK